MACLAGFDGREVARSRRKTCAAWRRGPRRLGRRLQPRRQDLATTSGKGGPLLLWDVPGRRALRALAVEADRSALAFLPAGSAVACGVGHDVVFVPIDGGPPRTVGLGAAGPARALPSTASVAEWPSRGRGITATIVESLVVYNLASMGPLRTFHGPMDSYAYKVPMDLDPKGTLPPRVRRVGPRGAGARRGRRSDAPPATLGHHAEKVCTLRFSPDGAELATTSNSGDLSIRISDVAGRRERLRLTGHTARVWGLAYSPEGDLLATSGDDETLRLWDTRDRPRPAHPAAARRRTLRRLQPRRPTRCGRGREQDQPFCP